MEAVIRLNQKDPCEGGNMIADDIGCTLARAIILGKYYEEYTLVYKDDSTSRELFTVQK